MKTKKTTSKSSKPVKATKTSKSKKELTPQELEAKKWVNYCIEKKVSTPFFKIEGQHIRRVSDGKEYTTLEEFYADGGSFDWTNDNNNVTQL